MDGLAQQVNALAAADTAAETGETAQNQRLVVMQGQLDTLNQQADTFAANDEAEQTDEAAQSAQLDDLAQQVNDLAAADATAEAGERRRTNALWLCRDNWTP